jgi:hypothetical protein
MRGRLIAGLFLVLLLVLAAFLYRGCRGGDGLPDEEARRAPTEQPHRYGRWLRPDIEDPPSSGLDGRVTVWVA